MAQSVNIAIKARDNASKHFKKAGSSAKRFGKTIAGVAGVVGAYLGIRKLFSFTKESIKLFNIQAEAVRSLTDAMRLLNAEAQVPEMRKFASDLQKITIYGDEATMKLMQLGVSMGKFTGDTLKSATIASIGLADALQIDTASAMKLVAKASAGDTGSLSRYGIILDSTMTKQEKFAELLRIGAENFEVSKGKTQTFGGAMKQLGNSWGDAKEKLGSYIAGNAKAMYMIKWTQTVIENFGTSMQIVWTSTALGIVRFYENVKHYMSAGVEWVVYLAENWKDVFKTVWNFTKTVFSNMAENAKNFFKSLWSWMKGDDFNFKWTGLLEGFESTLKDMPKIAKRNVGEVEQALMEELAGHKGKFRDALAQKMEGAGSGIDVDAMLANAKATGVIDTGKEKKKGSLSAVEGRFLTGQIISRDYAKDSAQESKKQTPLLQKIADKMDRLRETYEKVASSGGVTESNFA